MGDEGGGGLPRLGDHLEIYRSPLTLGTYLPPRLQGIGKKYILGPQSTKWPSPRQWRWRCPHSTPRPTSPGGGVREGGLYSRSGGWREEEHELPNTMVYYPWYKEAQWNGICDQAGPMRNVIKYARALKLDQTISPPGRSQGNMPLFSYKGPLQCAMQEGGVPPPLPLRGLLAPTRLWQQGHTWWKSWRRWGRMMPPLKAVYRELGTGHQCRRVSTTPPYQHRSLAPTHTSMETTP